MSTDKSILNRDALISYFKDAGFENFEEMAKNSEKDIYRMLKKQATKHIAEVDEAYVSAENLLTVYPDVESLKLPSWIMQQIDKARVIGNSKQTVILPDGQKYQLNNTLNHLSGKEWTKYINSVFLTAYPSKGKESYAHDIRKIHPTPKPPQLMRDIISFFTKENEIVLDYFMGVGGSLLGASMAGRRAIGIDLNSTYIETYQRAARALDCEEFTCLTGDCLEILSNEKLMSDLLLGEKVSLVLIDPPYGNMMSREKTGGDISVYGNIATPFTDSEKDLGNLELPEFFQKLTESVERVMPYIKKHGHVVVFIKDLQPNKKTTNLLHAEIVKQLNTIDNLYYKGMRIWVDQTAKFFPYGYPFSFVANQIHQYILVFRKEKER